MNTNPLQINLEVNSTGSGAGQSCLAGFNRAAPPLMSVASKSETEMDQTRSGQAGNCTRDGDKLRGKNGGGN